MKLGIYAFFDRVSHSYGEPFVAVNKDVAVRRFQYVMSNSPMVAQDMQLYSLGEFDTDSGVIVPQSEFVCNYEKQEA